MENVLIVPCSIESISTRRDKTLKVVIGTQELSPNKVTELMTQWSNGYGVMSFKGSTFTGAEVEVLKDIKLDAEELGSKTPSQRLRSTLYVLYERNPEGYKDFTSYYISAMERIISMVRKKIEAYDI